MVVPLGTKAPNLKVAEWVQGKQTNIDREKGNVVLVEVFQVNCPGCFMYGIPEAINIYNKYGREGVSVLGLATAFEDFEKNTLDNLKRLVSTGEVIGETYNALSQYGKLSQGNKLPYKIPFPIAMDFLKRENGSSQSRIADFIETHIPDYRSYPEKERASLIERVKEYLANKVYSPETFEDYNLRGTPSAILIDKKGILRQNIFGSTGVLEEMIKDLLNE
jgi:thiol-disulfide isomerase/thioredoxin